MLVQSEDFLSEVESLISEVTALSATALYLYSTSNNVNERLEYLDSINKYNNYLVKLNELKNSKEEI